jgi:FAD/FMN-containing dehydrogenase
MAAAAAGAAGLAACSHGTGTPTGQPSPSPAATLSRRPSPSRTRSAPAASDWAALGRDLDGRLVRPGDDDYAVARLLFDPRFDTISPAAVAYCRHPADVAACLAFARGYAVPLAARSGGHSYAGWSGTPGLIVDVTGMASVRLDGASGLARVGAGTFLIDMYSQLLAGNAAVPGGSCPNVGVAGLTLGGGIGVVSRAFGLTCDNLEAVQIVTADGRIRDCDRVRDSDLYWASRGGGGGNFGVATSFTFRTHAAPADVVLFFLGWPWAQASQVIAGWQSWAPHAPDQLWSNLHLSARPGGGTPSIQVGGTYLGSVSDAASQLDKLYAAVGSGPSTPYMRATTYLDAMLVDAGCAGMSVAGCHLPWQAAGGTLTRQPELAKSDFFTRPLSGSAIGTLLTGVEGLQPVQGTARGEGGVAFDACGGAVNRVGAGQTAFVHRDALFLAQYTTTWDTGSPPRRAARQRDWQRALYASMRPYASGQAYQNYVDPDLTTWRQAYYGANYPRLARVKAAYDPDGLFRFPQAIG